MVGLRTMLSAAALCVASVPANAGGGYDTNHPDVRWRTLETEHFAFHWPESKRDKDDPHWFTTRFTASHLATIAENAWEPICSQLDYYPKETIHVVIYDQDIGWEGNGFAIAEWDWTGFAADWGPLFRQRGRMEFLSDVFVHEFAHIVSLKAYLPWAESSTGFELGGLSEDEEWLKRWGIRPKVNTNFDIGFSLLFSAHTPFWWAEGGAEYWSHHAGYNFWGTSRDAYLRTTFLEDRVLNVDEWTTRIDKRGFDGERGYNQGYAFGLYLRNRFGDDAMSEMAKVSAKRWHWSWDRVVESVTGVDMQVLFDDWLDYAGERFAAQAKAVEDAGVVQGGELSLTRPAWEATEGEAAAEWKKLSKRKKEEQMDGETAYQEHPRYSPDGTMLAWFENGLNIMKIRPDQWGAIGGTYIDPKDSKTLRTLNQGLYNNDWIRGNPVHWSPDSTQIIAVGPEDWAARGFMDQGLQLNADGYNWNQLLIGTVTSKGKRLHVKWKPVPNTLRATEASWSPDGNTLAFARYGDGTQELWTIRPDGSEATQISAFNDGTQIQGLHWTPDGTSVITALFRNYRQDLWRLNLETREWTRLTDNQVDELDPTVSADGHIWFASDWTGIYNIYSLDPASLAVQQHTNVIGSAYAPNTTPEGHLLFTDFTGHGYRIRALPASKLMKSAVDYPGICSQETDSCAMATKAIAYQPPDFDILEQSKRYNPLKAQMPFSIWPVVRTTDRNVEVGSSFYMGDYAEKHALEGQVTFGKDNYLYLGYWNSQFWPTIGLGYSRYSYKGSYGYGEDLDGDPTTEDMRIVDVKFEQLAEDAWVSLSYLPSYAIWVGLSADWTRYSFRDTGDGPTWQPFQVSSGLGAYVEWAPRGAYYSGDDWINPRGGRRVYFDYSHRWSRIVDPETSGAVYDDGQLMEQYQYNRLQISWTEFIPVPWSEHHTLQLDFDLGYIDRNVMGWDEFMAGGRHPYNWGNGTIGNNIQFSGFEGFSLSGETMLIANAAYRFPLARDLNFKMGPIYTDALYLQFFGSIGNLWSYRVEGPSHVEGYSVVPSEGGTVRRELPFSDYASKNSLPAEKHYYLSDIGAELRIRAFIWNDWDWDGFVRFSYGLQSTAGYGDVNADLIQSSVARDAATELSAEIEPPTLRVYAGIGTGW